MEPSSTITICDTDGGKIYTRGDFLGKGSYGACYSVREIKGDRSGIHACKIVSKCDLKGPDSQKKIKLEILIHRGLQHKNIVRFLSHFEDYENHYIILELCSNKSLAEMQKRRRIITELEARYYLQQILSAVHYLHGQRIIHRDLKLGNIFLNYQMTIKIGDFGLSAKILHSRHKRKTICGTPNYIAPEILLGVGHGTEADIWSIGCILYTFLFGNPPFLSDTKEDIYKKIKQGVINFPNSDEPMPGYGTDINISISNAAKKLIMQMLQKTPKLRPKAIDILDSEFLQSNNPSIPSSLPESALTTVPRFPNEDISHRHDTSPKTLHLKLEQQMKSIQTQLRKVLQRPENQLQSSDDRDLEKPTSAPVFWILKWYSNLEKEGSFGYHLCDGSYGLSFNDGTKMILLNDVTTLQYLNYCNQEYFYTIQEYPQELSNKVQILNYYVEYMDGKLKNPPGQSEQDANVSMMTRLPTLYTWFYTTRSCIMLLTNGTIQINRNNHIRIILCPILNTMTIWDTNMTQSPVMRTFKLSRMEKYGYSLSLRQQLQYTLQKINDLISVQLPNQSPQQLA